MARNAWRACPTPGCPQMVHGPGRCTTCAKEAERKRGTAHQRGYDARHRSAKERLLADLRRDLAAGRPPWTCARCEQPMTPEQDLQHGHSRDRVTNPGLRADRLEHAHCNLSAGGRLGAAITNSR